jgi:excisionase family DNA binding protein
MSVRDSVNTNKVNNVDYSKLVSVTQASIITGIHTDTIYKLIKDGSIRVFGFPRCYRVLVEDVMQDKRSLYTSRGQHKRNLSTHGTGEDRILVGQDAESSETEPMEARKRPIDPADDPDASA